MLIVIWLLAATNSPASQPASLPAFSTLTGALETIRADTQASTCAADLSCWKGRVLRLDGALSAGIAGLGQMQAKYDAATELNEALTTKHAEDAAALTVAGSTMKQESAALVTPFYREPWFMFTLGMLTASAVLALAIEGYDVLRQQLAR